MLHACYTMTMQCISQPALRPPQILNHSCMQTDQAEGVHRIEQQRRDLEPHVTKWRAYEARALVFQTRKLDFMQQQAESLASSITATSNQVPKYLCLSTVLQPHADVQIHNTTAWLSLHVITTQVYLYVLLQVMLPCFVLHCLILSFVAICCVIVAKQV